MRHIILFIALLPLGACVTDNSQDAVSSAERPSWMENPSIRYPRKYFLIAVGEGDTLSGSQDAAAANLAKIFKTDIKVEETLNERYFEMIGKKNSYQEKTAFNRDVLIKSGVTLVNVQYAQSYRDQTGRIYTLAYIDRRRTAEIYLTRLKEDDARITEFVRQSESDGPELRYAALSAALAVARGSRLLLRQLDIISPAAKTRVGMTYSYDRLSRMYSDAAAAIKFSVNIRGDIDSKINASLKEMLTDMGFTVTDDSPLKISGRVDFQDTDLKRGNLVFVRYDLKLSVKDAAGETVVGLTRRGRDGHVSRTEAQARCIRSIVNTINRQFRTDLQNYFDGLVKK